MSVMEWTPKMSVGLAVLDDDHKQLVRIINQLGADSLKEDRRAAATVWHHVMEKDYGVRQNTP